MRPLAKWSVLDVVLVCAGWVVLCLLVPLLWVVIQLQLQMAAASDSAGGVGLAVGVNTLVVVLPPALLCLAWVGARHRAKARS